MAILYTQRLKKYHTRSSVCIKRRRHWSYTAKTILVGDSDTFKFSSWIARVRVIMVLPPGTRRQCMHLYSHLLPSSTQLRPKSKETSASKFRAGILTGNGKVVKDKCPRRPERKKLYPCKNWEGCLSLFSVLMGWNEVFFEICAQGNVRYVFGIFKLTSGSYLCHKMPFIYIKRRVIHLVVGTNIQWGVWCGHYWSSDSRNEHQKL